MLTELYTGYLIDLEKISYVSDVKKTNKAYLNNNKYFIACIIDSVNLEFVFDSEEGAYKFKKELTKNSIYCNTSEEHTMSHNIIGEPTPDKVLTADDWKAIAEKLWCLLDDIDTASDMFKPSDLAGHQAFYRYTMKRAEERGKYLASPDGYNLLPV